MKQLKRIILLLGFIPVMIIGAIRWILTGKDIIEFEERFVLWCQS